MYKRESIIVFLPPEAEKIYSKTLNAFSRNSFFSNCVLIISFHIQLFGMKFIPKKNHIFLQMLAINEKIEISKNPYVRKARKIL